MHSIPERCVGGLQWWEEAGSDQVAGVTREEMYCETWTETSVSNIYYCALNRNIVHA